MTSKKMNVLVYAGNGASLESVKQCLYSLRRLLSPNYAVITITAETLLKEPWAPTCALLVMPGGADMGYCRVLNGHGNRLIRQYVEAGGAYLGLCAGGYYGTGKCEFEIGDPAMEVIGSRELAFFPGISRGSAFKGFVYNSEAGTRAAELKVDKQRFGTAGNLPELFRCYFNGGSCFVDAKKYADKGVTVLAEYASPLDVQCGDTPAAVIHCSIGNGSAILTGPHPEFASINLSKHSKGMTPGVVEQLEEHDAQRAQFFKACLAKLNLQVNDQEQALPSLTAIHISSNRPQDVTKLSDGLASSLASINNEQYLKAEVDTFCVKTNDATWSMRNSTKAALEILTQSATAPEEDSEQEQTSDRIMDYSEIVKTLILHQTSQPSAKDTPYFNQAAYYSNLSSYNNAFSDHIENDTIGRMLLYGEVVTSTSTLLEKNSKLTTHLPHGATLTATTQLSGRGRGSNVWISPAGSLMFSTILRHPMSLNLQAPVVFIQYLAALAIVEGIQNYDDAEPTPSWSSSAKFDVSLLDDNDALTGPAFRGLSSRPSKQVARTASAYRDMPIKLKWPNDIYASDPANPGSYVKIGGILVNSDYSGGDFNVVLGVGLSVSNAAPTTSLNALLDAVNKRRKAQGGAELEAFTLEKVLARILSTFAAIYTTFKRQGFGGDLERLYYKHWLHGGQIVTLETEGNAKARIRGITSDWGLLKAEEIDSTGSETGKMFALQTDSNSFDFMKGLIKRKL